MSELRDETLGTLGEAATIAQEAAEELWQRKRKAFEEQDFEEYARCAAAYRDALTVQDRATERLIAGILEPTGANVQSLKAAVAELKARLEALKAAEATLTDLAAGLGILTHVILLFGMA
jgi:hypothetical protein